MENITFTQIIEALPDLPLSRLRLVLTTIQELLLKDESVSKMQSMFYNTIITELKNYGVSSIPMLNTFLLHSRLSKAYSRVCEFLEEFIEEFFYPRSHVERMASLRFLVKLVVEEIRKRDDYTLSASTVVTTSVYLRSIVEAAFPGYMETKCLCVLIRKK